MSYAVQQDVLRVDSFEASIIEYLCREANSLKNCAMYQLKRAYRQANQVDFDYYALDKWMKDLDNKHYRMLYSQVAQQALAEVCESFKSFSELLSDWFAGKMKHRPKPPHYRKSGGLSGITYPAQNLELDRALITGMFRLPLGATFKAENGVSEIWLPIPANFDHERVCEISEVRIFPRNKTFYIEFVYLSKREKVSLNPLNALGFDPGVKNWLTGVSTTGDSFIVDGKVANTWNNRTNRESGKYQDDFWSRNLALTHEKRNRRMRDYINKICRKVAEYCVESDIGTVVFGWNDGVKNESNIGKRNNQNFVQLPTAKLKNRMKSVLEEIGIRFVETEESYTSKASFLDNDSLPTFGEKPADWKASGKRITTKLYRTAKGYRINADCNGAANILRKVATELELNLANVNRGVVTSPRRVTLATLNRKNFSIASTAT